MQRGGAEERRRRRSPNQVCSRTLSGSSVPSRLRVAFDPPTLVWSFLIGSDHPSQVIHGPRLIRANATRRSGGTETSEEHESGLFSNPIGLLRSFETPSCI